MQENQYLNLNEFDIYGKKGEGYNSNSNLMELSK